MRVLAIIFGILLVIGGGYCLLVPFETYAAVVWLIGLAMIVEGVGSAVTWSDRRKLGLADGWTLAGAILSIVLGVFLLGSFAFKFAVDFFIAYLIALWLVFGGIARIAAAIGLRSYRNETGDKSPRTSWVGLLVLGIVVVILGVLCIFNPLAVMVSVGFLLGLAIICAGVGLIVRGIVM